MPLITLVLLFRNIKKKESKITQYFLILYQGLKPDKFYWEFVNTLRKSLVLASLLLPNNIKLIASALILFSTGRIQMALKPYKNNENNKVEFLAILAGVFTILSSLIFSSEEKVKAINTIVLVFMIIFNLNFLSQWLYLLIQIYEDKYRIASIVNF